MEKHIYFITIHLLITTKLLVIKFFFHRALVAGINDMLLQINQDVNQTKKTSIPDIINKTTKSTDVKLRRPNAINAMQVENSSNMNANMHMNNTDVTHNSINNGIQDRYLSGQHDMNVSQVRITDQPVATKTKEFFHRLHKYNNTSENTNQLRRNEYFSTLSLTEQSHSSCNYESDSNRISPNKKKYDNNIKDKTYNNYRNHPQKDDLQNDKSSVCHNSREDIRQETITSYNSSLNNDLSFYKDTHLSKTKFTMVEIIISLGNDEYWINKVEDKDARLDLMRKLQDVTDKSSNVQLVIGEVYGVLYETLWHRAMVTSLNPTKIHFIDFGNDAILKKDDKIKNIGDLVKAPKFARKIRLTQGTSDKYRNLQESENISVRMLSMDSEKTIIVEVQEQLESLSSHTMANTLNNTVKKLVPQENYRMSPNKSTKTSTVQIPNVLDTLAELRTQNTASELQIEGFVQILEFAQKNVYSVTLVPQVYVSEIEMIYNDLQEECSKVQVATDYKYVYTYVLIFKYLLYIVKHICIVKLE